VPTEMMDKLTLMEIACDLNIEYLNALMYKGIVESVKDAKTGKVVMINQITKNWTVPNPPQLQIKDRVSRFLLHADPMIAGRQPTIRDGSCQGFNIMAVEGKAFKLPLSHTIATNADFDGDEMYIQILQDARARVEAKELMGMSKLIVSPQTNSPIMNLTQDSLVAVFVLSQTHDLPRDLAFDCVMSCTDFLKIGRRRLDPEVAAQCVHRFIARPGKEAFYKQLA
jgi:DNA-directed RNA polymerase beta' subunit